MNITLRKANTIQNSINDLLKSITVVDTLSLNEFEDAELSITAKDTEAHIAYKRQLLLVEALYDIRSNVAKINHESGTTEMLTQIARLDKLIVINQKMADRPVRMNAEVVKGKLDKIRNSKDDSHSRLYDRYNEVSTGLNTESNVVRYKEIVAAHKREKQRLQDIVLENNVRNEITLTSMTEQTLHNEGLI